MAGSGLFPFTQEHEMIRKAAQDFAQKEIAPIAAEFDETGEFPIKTVKKMGEMGFMGIEVPEEDGGAGMDTLSYVLAEEEIAKVDAAHGVIMSVNNSLYCTGILKFGTEEQKKKFITPVASAQVGSHWQIYWDDVQPDLTATPDWRQAQTRVAAVATQGEKTLLSVLYYQESAAAATDQVMVPSGVATVAYDQGTGCGTDYAPDYGADSFLLGYKNMVASLLATFGTDANVLGFLIEMGLNGDNINTYERCAGARAAREAQTDCDEYKEHVYGSAAQATPGAMHLYRSGTTKPIFIRGGNAMCDGGSMWRSLEYVFNDHGAPTTATPTPGGTPVATATRNYIGYLSSALQAARQDAWANVNGQYAIIEMGARMHDIGGAAEGVARLVAMAVFFTAGAAGPFIIPTERKIGTYDRLLAAPMSLLTLLLGKTAVGGALLRLRQGWEADENR